LKKTKLFCFPYAGGSATVYARWKDFLHRSIELVPIELAGRGRRIYDSHYNHLDDALEDVLNIIKDQLSAGPYALLGHSLGGLIAYELTYKIKENNLPNPVHLFISGRGAPHVPRSKERKMYHKMPDAEFKEEIMNLGGTPREFFDHPELLEVLLPTLKNDFKVAETYVYKHKDVPNPIDHDLTIFIGKDEEVSAEQMFGWREQTNKVCSLHYFEGEHFFLHHHVEKLVSIINNTLVHR
jgi:medium-chain acyl-[acyl-carrier-protein] hydrolase